MSFPRYESCKDSGVGWLGEVPSHWSILQGRRIFRQVRIPAFADDQQLSSTQKYGVVPQKLFMEWEDQKVTLALTGIENFKHVDSDDFVISLRSFQGGIERSKYPGCVSPAYTVLKAELGVDANYWAYLLKAGPYIAALQSVTDGIRDGKNISYEQFGQIRLPFPLQSEQTAIAAFLDREAAKIDGLIEEQQRLVALLKEKRRAAVSHAVTKGLDPDVPLKDSGVEWLGTVPSHWSVNKLVRLTKSIGDGLHGTPTYDDSTMVYFINGNNLVDGRIQITDTTRSVSDVDASKYRIPLDDRTLLLSINGTIGNTALFRGESVILGKSAAYIQVGEKINREFLSYFIQSYQVMSHFGQVATRPRLAIFHWSRFEIFGYLTRIS